MVFRVTFGELEKLGEIETAIDKGIYKELRKGKRVGKGWLKTKLEEPLIILYKGYWRENYIEVYYILTEKYIDIEVSDEVMNLNIFPEKPSLFFMGKLAPFINTLGLAQPAILFKKVSHRKWGYTDDGKIALIGGKENRNTSTFSEVPNFTEIELPDENMVLNYIKFRPRIPLKEAIRKISKLTEFPKPRTAELIAILLAKDYLKEVEYLEYPEEYIYLLATKIVSKNEGLFTFSDLQGELTKYGVSYRKAFDYIFEAFDEGLIKSIKGKYYTTDEGKKIKLPSGVKKVGLMKC